MRSWKQLPSKMQAVHPAICQVSFFSVSQDSPKCVGVPHLRGHATDLGKVRLLREVGHPDDIFRDGIVASKIVKEDYAVKSARKRHQKYHSEQLDAFTKRVQQRVTIAIKNFDESLQNLHPFEDILVESTLNARENKKKSWEKFPVPRIVENLKETRAVLTQESRKVAKAIKLCRTKKDITTTYDNGIVSMRDAIEGASTALREARDIRFALQKLPAITLNDPLIALVGMPNVGKSSIVKSISSGKPEIQNYPFTTKSIHLGHIFGEDDQHSGKAKRYQVIDTPGMLHRAHSERNMLELLTVSAIRDLPSAIVFVTDFSGTCGQKSDIQKQLAVRQQLYHSICSCEEMDCEDPSGRLRWIDVISKHDLPIDPAYEGVAEGEDFAEAIRVSTVDYTGLSDLKAAALEMMKSHPPLGSHL